MIDISTLFNQIALPVLTASGAALVALGAKKIKDSVSGDLTLEKNASTIARQAKMQSKLRECINKEGIRSILVEGAGAVYYAVKGATPEVMRFDMFNKDDMAQLQKVMPHLSNPEHAHKIAIGPKSSEVSYKTATEFNQKGSSWLKDKSKNNALIDEAMMLQLDALVSSNDISTSLSAPCHIALKRTNSKEGADIVLMSVSKKFQKSFKSEYGVENLSDFRFKPDAEIFDMFIATRINIASKSDIITNKAAKPLV